MLKYSEKRKISGQDCCDRFTEPRIEAVIIDTQPSSHRRSVLLLMGLLLVSVLPTQAANTQVGKCQISPQEIVTISSPVSGLLQAINFSRNDRISQGQVVAQLESSQEHAKVSRARVQAQSNTDQLAKQTQLDLALLRQKEIEQNLADGKASSAERDAAAAEVLLASLELERAKERNALAELDLAEAVEELNRKVVRSPVSGIVMESFYSPGEQVTDKPIIKVAVMDPLKVDAALPASRFGAIETGMRAMVHPAFPEGSAFEAELTNVSPFINRVSNSFEVRLELPNSDYLIPSGITCRLELLPALEESADNEPDASSSLESSDMPNSPGFRMAPTLNINHSDAIGPSADFLVLTPVIATQDATAELLANLHAQGVTDTAELKRGPYRGRISLGVYAGVGWAEKRRNQLAKLGFESEIVQRHTNSKTSVEQSIELSSGANAITHSSHSSLANIDNELSGPLTCKSIGPLSSIHQIEAVEVALLEENVPVKANRRMTDAPAVNDFLLLSPLQKTPEETRELMERMKRAGINDIALIGTGQFEGRISLGVYRNKDLAEEKNEELAALGFPAKLIWQMKKGKNYWLDLEMPADKSADKRLTDLIHSVVTGDSLQIVSCHSLVKN